VTHVGLSPSSHEQVVWSDIAAQELAPAWHIERKAPLEEVEDSFRVLLHLEILDKLVKITGLRLDQKVEQTRRRAETGVDASVTAH
jgi:hypothetical protein